MLQRLKLGGIRVWLRRSARFEASLIPPAFTIMFATLASKFLGMARDALFASRFGVTPEYSAYLYAFRIPDLLTGVFVLGAFSSAFMPVFARYLEEGKEKKAWKIADVVITLLMLILVGLGLIIFALAPMLVNYFVIPGATPEMKDTTTLLLRIMIVSPVLLGISNVLSGVLNSHHKFTASAFAPVFYNVGLLAGVIWFIDWFGMVWGLGFGVVVGAALHALVQVWPAVKLGFHWRFDTDFRLKEVQQVIHLALPRMFGAGVMQTDLFVDVILASYFLTEESYGLLNFANRLQTLPVGLFGMAIATAAYPRLVRSAANGMKKFSEELLKNITYVLYFTLPASIAFIILRVELVRLLFGQSGKLDWVETRSIAFALALYSISIFAQSLNYVLNRAFYALQDTKTPLLAGFISVVMNSLLSFVLVKTNPHFSMLALSFTFASLTNMALLLVLLYDKVGVFQFREFTRPFAGILGATLIAGGYLFLVESWLSTNVFDLTRVRDLIFLLGICLSTGAVVYIAAAEFFGTKVLHKFSRFLGGKNAV
jgi:putative peptidoglycan lipid II flippase